MLRCLKTAFFLIATCVTLEMGWHFYALRTFRDGFDAMQQLVGGHGFCTDMEINIRIDIGTHPYMWMCTSLSKQILSLCLRVFLHVYECGLGTNVDKSRSVRARKAFPSVGFARVRVLRLLDALVLRCNFGRVFVCTCLGAIACWTFQTSVCRTRGCAAESSSSRKRTPPLCWFLFSTFQFRLCRNFDFKRHHVTSAFGEDGEEAWWAQKSVFAGSSLCSVAFGFHGVVLFCSASIFLTQLFFLFVRPLQFFSLSWFWVLP